MRDVWTSENNGGGGTAFEPMGDHFTSLLENHATEPVLSVLWTPWLDLGNDAETLTSAQADQAAQSAILEALAMLHDGQTEDDGARLHAMIGAIVAYREALKIVDEHVRRAWVERSCAFLALAGAP